MANPNQPLPAVNRPLFVIGVGRCGTTLMFNILTTHPQCAWPCQYMVGERLSGRELLFHRLKKLPLMRRFIGAMYPWRRPVSEPYVLWEGCTKAFRRPYRDLDERDVPCDLPADMRTRFARQMQCMDRPRFLTKYTGWSRMRFIDAVFPDALFLNVIRDGRAVAASLLRTDFWRGWQDTKQWRWGELNDEDRVLWERADNSFFVLAGLQWKILMENLTQQGALLGDRYREVRYEELMRAPEETLCRVVEWAGLVRDEAFLAHVRQRKLLDANAKWRMQIAPSEQQIFNAVLGPTLSKHGYKPDPIKMMKIVKSA